MTFTVSFRAQSQTPTLELSDQFASDQNVWAPASELLATAESDSEIWNYIQYPWMYHVGHCSYSQEYLNYYIILYNI